MTFNQLISQADALKPNRFPSDQKLKWVQELDKRILTEVISRCEGGEEASLPTDEHMIKGAYEEMYLYWLFAKMDLFNREMTGYNNHSAVFNEMYTAFVWNYIRTHKPLQLAKVSDAI